MANGYDGDIKLSVSLSPNDVKNSAKELSNQVKDIFNQSAGKELDVKFQRLQTQMSKSVSRAQELSKAMDELEHKKIPTQEYTEVSKRLENLNSQFDKLLVKQDEMQEAGKTSTASWQRLNDKMEQLGVLIHEDENELKQLVDTGKAFTLGSDTQQYQKISAQLGEVNNGIRTQITAYEGLANTTDNYVSPAMKRVKSSISSITSAALGLAKKGLVGLVNRFKQTGNAASNFAKKLNFTKILRYAFGIRSLFVLFNRIRSAITGALTDMAKMNGGVNQTNIALTQLTSMLNLVKGSLATAFTPILTAVTPMLSGFMQTLANVITMIGMFIAKLTGAKSYMRATFKSTDYAASQSSGGGGKSAQQKYEEAVKKAQERYDKQVEKITKSNQKKEAKAQERNAENAAKAEEKQAKAAAKLAKEQEKANNKLAAWDDLNVLGVESAEDELDALDELKEVEADLAELPELELPSLEDFLGGGGGAGAPFGLEEVPLDGLEFNWDDLLAKARELGGKLAEFLNDIFKDEELAKKIGNAIGNLINMAINFAYGFISKFDFLQFGHWLGTLIQEAIETIDWALLGETIGLGLNGLADTIIGFFERYDVGTLGSSIATMLNNAIKTVDPERIGKAVLEILQAPLIELTTLLTETNIQEAGAKVSEFFIRVFKGKGLQDKTLGQAIGEFLAAVINAGIDLLLGADVYGMITAIQDFFFDIFESAFTGIDWTDVFRAGIKLMFEALFSMIMLRVNEILFFLEKLHVISSEKAEEIRSEIDNMAHAVVNTVDEDIWEATNNFKGAAEEILSVTDDLKGKSDEWAQALKEIQQEYNYTDADMDKFIMKMTDQDEAFETNMGTLDGWKGSWREYKKLLEETPTSIDPAVKKQDELSTAVDGVGNKVQETAGKVNEYVKIAKTSIEEGTANAQQYSDDTVGALQAISDKGDEVVISFDTLEEQVGTELESLTTLIDEWYQNMITTYFGYDVWYLLLQEGMLLAFTTFFTTEFLAAWDTALQDWWENHVKPWFAAEKWTTDIYTVWETHRDTKWKALMKWWDDSMKKWWDEQVVPWFKEDKWKAEFQHIYDAADKMGQETRDLINGFADEVESHVVACVQHMIDKTKELIDELKEAIELASHLDLGGGGGGGSSSGGSSSNGGSSQGGGGGGRNFMPRLEIMHFEDNLGMSAFKFPELATGAVIPPNNKFLAVLGDQKSGMNIETPLATMVEAFRSVMDEYMTPGYGNATMEVDGETFARLMLPHVMNEMHRQGYNTEIIEGM